MIRRRFWLVTAGVILIILAGAEVVRNQMKVHRSRQARAAVQDRLRIAATGEADAGRLAQRRASFDLLKPVGLANCELKRFGEAHDGGYLLCGNLLSGVQAAYSYGISGYDQWGCDIATALNVTVHQYDCFDTRRPTCPSGKTVFHPECIGASAMTTKGRAFDTFRNQFAGNSDQSRRLVVKIDVEGTEWDSFLSAPDGILEQIDQMAVEFHWVQDGDGRWLHDDRYIRTVQRLRRFFEIVHVHFNNASCISGLEPFPAWAYEVLFVSKRLAVVDPARRASGLHPLDAPNNPSFPDCQS